MAEQQPDREPTRDPRELKGVKTIRPFKDYEPTKTFSRGIAARTIARARRTAAAPTASLACPTIPTRCRVRNVPRKLP